MKFNHILIVAAFLTTFQIGISQDNRTFETKVADALNILPASNSDTYSKTIQNLIQLGPEVIDELVRLYQVSEGDQRVQLDYAFSGIGKSLSSSSEQVRKSFSEVFVKNAQNNPSSELSVALLEELAYFLPGSQIEILNPLLKERYLVMRVLDILEMHPGQISGDMVWSAMNKADNRSRYKIYKILTDARFGHQDKVLNPSLANTHDELGQLILEGMAKSGDPKYLDYFTTTVSSESDPLLIDAAMRYATSLATNGRKSQAAEYLKKMIEKDHISLQSSAVFLLGRLVPDDAVEQIRSAFTSGVPEIAVAAAHTLPYLQSSQYGELVPSIEKAPSAALANAIRILTRKGWVGSEQLVRDGLLSHDTIVAAQAVLGLAELKKLNAQKDIIDFVKNSSNTTVVEAGVQALAMSTNTENIDAVATLIDQVEADKKTLLIPLVAARGGQRHFDQMLELASDSEGNVQRLAIASLAKLGETKDIPAVLGLLSVLPEDQVQITQSTLDKMLAESASTDWESTLLTSIEGDQKSKFIPLIGHLSGDQPKLMAKKILESDDDNITNQLLTTVGEWADASMVDMVISLMDNSEIYENAIKAAMGIIARSEWPDVRKILYLKKVYNNAIYPQDKSTVVQKISQFRNIYALITVGDYLENNKGSIQNAAAKGIMNIVMPGPQNNDGMIDSLAIRLLSKASQVISGRDSEYFKENINTYIESISSDAPTGFVTMFNGQNLEGWHGFVANPLQLERMSEKEIEQKLEASNQRMRNHWWVENGMIHFKGNGQNIVSDKNYRNFVMLVDWKIGDKGDSGIYLRGTPQVQIWDPSRTDVGAEVGSGGLYNNQKHASKPLVLADMPIGDWNHMKIAMMGDEVSVWLNGELVVDNVVMENYWDRTMPIFSTGPIELQAHGTDIAFKNIYIKEIPSGEDLLTKEEKEEGFTPLFNGFNLDGWTGNKQQYQVKNGVIVVDPEASGASGNLYTEKEYSDFNFRFEFLLTPGANNGLGIRAPLSGNAAYGGVELQILDNTASIYANLKPYQYHGSLYGVAPAERGHLKPVGEWNTQEVIIKGDRYQVILNGTKILDVDAKKATRNGTMDGKEHPGLKRDKGHIGFLGHGSELKFRNIRIKEL